MGSNTRPVQYLISIFAVTGLLMGCGETTDETTDCTITFSTVPSPEKEIAIRKLTQNYQEIAQSFQHTEALTDLSKFQVRLRKEGTISDDVTVTLTINSDNNDEPSTTVLGTATKKADKVFASASFVEFTLASAINLDQNTRYWIVLDADYASSDTDLIYWTARDETTNGYDNGRGLHHSASTTWLNTLVGSFWDFHFRVGC